MNNIYIILSDEELLSIKSIEEFREKIISKFTHYTDGLIMYKYEAIYNSKLGNLEYFKHSLRHEIIEYFTKMGVIGELPYKEKNLPLKTSFKLYQDEIVQLIPAYLKIIYPDE